jgi:hypothetical protein
VRIRLDPAMAGEMLAAGGHAGAVQAFDQRAASSTRGGVACNERSPMTLLRPQSRSSTGVNDRSTPQHAQFGGENVSQLARGSQRRLRITVPQFAETAHRRQRVKPSGSAAPGLLRGRWRSAGPVNAGMHLARQALELLRRLVVACKKNQASDQRMAQALAFEIGQAEPGQVDHQRAERA